MKPGKNIVRLFFYLAVVTIVVFSLKPIGQDSLVAKARITNSGMVLHLLGYFILTLTGFWSFRQNDSKPLRKIILINIGLGLLLEGIQYLLPYRTFNLWDIAGNLSGISTAGILIILFIIISKQKSHIK